MGIFNVILAIPLVHRFAAEGAGISVLATEVFVTLTMLVVLERRGIHIFGCSEVDA